MEKRKPHYLLSQIFELISKNRYVITDIAYDNAYKDFNYTRSDILNIIQTLSSEDFLKSMTTNYSHKIWQDVYNKELPNGEVAYIKVQIIDDKSVIIQFKRK